MKVATLVTRAAAAALCALALTCPATVRAQTIYSQDFQGAIGSEWSTTQTDVAPLTPARRFLGQFTNNAITLNLTNLPAHDFLTLSVQFLIIRSWDGNLVTNSEGNDVGPDVFDIGADSATLLHSTFSNWVNGEVAANPFVPQSYPLPFPGGVFAGRTGAAENNTLGFTYDSSIKDSVYNLFFAFPHTASTLTVTFQGIGLQPVSDESWGIDNVNVGIPAPEPGSLALLVLVGVPTVGMIRRRSRR